LQGVAVIVRIVFKLAERTENHAIFGPRFKHNFGD
jgi:hypothetical protein